MDCEQHEDHPVCFVCRTCGNTLVCLECIAGKHNGHFFGKLDVIAEQTRRKLYSKELESRLLLANLKADNGEMIEVLEKQGNECLCRQVSNQLPLLHSAVDLTANTLQSGCNHNSSASIKTALKTCLERIESVTERKRKLEEIAPMKDDLALICALKKLPNIDSNRIAYPKNATAKFTPGITEIHTNQIKKMLQGMPAEEKEEETAGIRLTQIGKKFSILKSEEPDSCYHWSVKRQKTEVIWKTTFQSSTYIYMHEMCVFPEEDVWFKCVARNEISLIRRNGTVQKTVKFDSELGGMTTTNPYTILVCNCDSRCIDKVILPEGKITRAFTTGGLIPMSICASNTGELFVTVVDDDNIYSVTSNSVRVLARFSPKGVESRRVQRDKRGGLLFNHPDKVKVNNSGDRIAVVNYCTDKNNYILIFNKDLSLRYRYLGDGKLLSGDDKFDTVAYKPSKDFSIGDMAFDPSDNILICEFYTKTVQLLSRDCVLLRTIIPTQTKTPRCLAFVGDELWIGDFYGTVNVYTYP